jgi:hypothetical protein
MSVEEWNEAELNAELFDFFGFDLRRRRHRSSGRWGATPSRTKLHEAVNRKRYEEKEAVVGPR